MLKKLKKSKKAIIWSEIAKWAIIGVLIIVIILAIITPVRQALFEKLGEFVDILRFGN